MTSFSECPGPCYLVYRSYLLRILFCFNAMITRLTRSLLFFKFLSEVVHDYRVLSVVEITTRLTLGFVALFCMGAVSVVGVAYGFNLGSVVFFCMGSVLGWIVDSIVLSGDVGGIDIFKICAIIMHVFVDLPPYVSLVMFFCGAVCISTMSAATWRKYKSGLTCGNGICCEKNVLCPHLLFPPFQVFNTDNICKVVNLALCTICL